MPKQFLKTDKNLIDSILILNKKKINYWLCHGTLLGIIRDKSLIKWDHDIDIGIWKKDFKYNLEEFFLKKGFKLKKKFFKNDGLITFVRAGGREVDINLYEISKDKKYAFQRHYAIKNTLCRLIYVLSISGSYQGRYNKFINIFFFMRSFFLKIKKFLISKNYFFKESGFKTQISFFKNLKKINFYGFSLNIPIDHRRYFVAIYGENWKIKDKSYYWERNPRVSNVTDE